MNSILRAAAAATLVLSAGLSAHAAPVTSLPGSTTYAFPVVNLFGDGPEAVTADISWSSTDGSSVFGYTGGYGFGVNGSWGAGPSMIGSNTPTATMRIDFANDVSGVGAFLNYAPGSGAPATIAVYDSSDALIESYVLNFATGGGVNQGEFHGFSEGSANIAYMTLSGSFIGAANLQVVAGNQVPEPASLALTLAAIGGLALVRRRKAA